jgi:hypothetical protein
MNIKKTFAATAAIVLLAIPLAGVFQSVAKADDLVPTFHVSTGGDDTGDGSEAHPFATIQAAINATSIGGVVDIAAGTYQLSAQLNVTQPISIVGEGVVILKSVDPSWSTVSGQKHLIAIYAGTLSSPVTISNVTLDANNLSYGVNVYNYAYGILNDVTIKNSKGAGLTVNGSRIVATNLNTNGNLWGSVNVDPGSGVLTTSAFTLNSGNLSEDNQIWSDGSHVSEMAAVAVTASGYNQYRIAGTPASRWVNRPLTNAVTIAENPGVIYTSIPAAVTAVSDGGVVNIAAGTYILSAELDITKSFSLVGAGTVIVKGVNASWGSTSVDNHLLGIYAGILATPITISNITFDSNNQSYGLNTYNNAYAILNGVTIKNSKGAGLTVGGSTVVATNLNTNSNFWGAVNVDPGLNVTTASVFKLNSGDLSEDNQIWSDGRHVSESATVAVTADGYGKYSVAGTTVTIWTNRPLTKAVTITENPGVIYSSIQAAIDAASAGNTIKVTSGRYPGDVMISKSISLLGSNFTVNPNSTTPRATEAIIVGQVNVNAGDVTVKGFTVTNPTWSGATIKGLHVYSNDPIISNITVQNNIFDGIANGQAHGSYGIMVQGEEDGVTISNNAFKNITSQGWAHALEITPTGVNPVVPKNISVTGNNFSSVTNANGNDAYAFSVDFSNTIFADASQITFNHNGLNGLKIRNLDTLHSLNATNNWWGSVSPNFATLAGSHVSYDPWFLNPGYTLLSSTQENVPQGTIDASSSNINFNSNATGEADMPTGITDIVLSNSTNIDLSNSTNVITSAPVTIGGNVINMEKSVVLQSGTATHPIVITNPALSQTSVSIPDATNIKGPTGWDGTINPPATVTRSGTAPAGFSVGSVSISVGSPDSTLVFDKAVKITLPDLTGIIAYKSAGSDMWKSIDTQCISATDHSNISFPNECYFKTGSSTTIWTYHFTTFGSITQNPSNSGGGGNFAPAPVVTTPTLVTPAPVVKSNPIVTPTPVASVPNLSNPNSNGRVLGANTGVGAHTEGTFVIDGKTVYLIKNGELLAFTNLADFLSYGRVKLQKIADADRLLPMIITHAKPGTVVWVRKEREYYLINANSEKQKYASYRAFRKSGHKLSQLRIINLDGYSSGDVIK